MIASITGLGTRQSWHSALPGSTVKWTPLAASTSQVASNPSLSSIWVGAARAVRSSASDWSVAVMSGSPVWWWVRVLGRECV